MVVLGDSIPLVLCARSIWATVYPRCVRSNRRHKGEPVLSRIPALIPGKFHFRNQSEWKRSASQSPRERSRVQWDSGNSVVCHPVVHSRVELRWRQETRLPGSRLLRPHSHRLGRLPSDRTSHRYNVLKPNFFHTHNRENKSKGSRIKGHRKATRKQIDYSKRENRSGWPVRKARQRLFLFLLTFDIHHPPATRTVPQPPEREGIKGRPRWTPK